MAAPKIGDRLINESGTVVILAEADDVFAGEVALERADAFIAAGYRPLKSDDIIPQQAWEVDAERRKRDR